MLQTAFQGLPGVPLRCRPRDEHLGPEDELEGRAPAALPVRDGALRGLVRGARLANLGAVEGVENGVQTTPKGLHDTTLNPFDATTTLRNTVSWLYTQPQKP